MKRILLIISGCILATTFCSAAALPPRELLLFSDAQDITNAWGKIHFGVTPLQRVAACKDPGFEIIYSEPREDGSCLIYGSAFTPDKDYKKLTDSAADMARTKHTWNIVRAVTRDGINFENIETVYESAPANWTVRGAMAYNPKAKEYLLLRTVTDNNGFGFRAFFSPDGKNWKLHSNEPLFYNGDWMSLYWDSQAGRFVIVTKALQPVLKRFWDHGGGTSSLHNDNLRDRRVLIIRTSEDGRRWTPPDSMEDIWDRRGKKTHLRSELLTTPDADDPPEMEFYTGSAFWHHDRSYMMVLNYAPSPLSPRKHAPQMDTEWWIGRDGGHWERPGRNVNASGDEILRVTHNPIILGGKFLFHHRDHVVGMKQDRISYVGARANAEFSTTTFSMPKGDLWLNAAAPAPERAFATQQAYIMASVLDENGNVIPGFEADKCIIKSADDINLSLLWNGKSARELAGRKISLRFQLRSANIYAVTFKK